ncbi:MAG: leucine-rich repeat domain-containing protein [Bacteroidaceae bacterium]|nr:leucine-rich repeat domain-containing protein [Bacteroidaceae bacterium]
MKKIFSFLSYALLCAVLPLALCTACGSNDDDEPAPEPVIEPEGEDTLVRLTDGTFTDGEFIYKVTSATDKELELIGCVDKSTKSALIPSKCSYEDQVYTVTSIGYSAFAHKDDAGNYVDNTSLRSVIFPGTVTTIAEDAFYCCKALARADLPTSLKSIGNKAFYYCSSLERLDLPSSLTSIGSEAFYYCKSLKGNLKLPSSLSSVGSGAFQHCAGFTRIDFDAPLTTIESNVFSDTGLDNVTIPSSVTTIGDAAFKSCGNLTEISIPSSVTAIGNQAFYQCGRLRRVNIPASVTVIGSQAFIYCSKLKDVYVHWKSPESVSVNNVHAQPKDYRSFNPCNNLHVPAGTKDSYASAPLWENFQILEDADKFPVK